MQTFFIAALFAAAALGQAKAPGAKSPPLPPGFVLDTDVHEQLRSVQKQLALIQERLASLEENVLARAILSPNNLNTYSAAPTHGGVVFFQLKVRPPRTRRDAC